MATLAEQRRIYLELVEEEIARLRDVSIAHTTQKSQPRGWLFLAYCMLSIGH